MGEEDATAQATGIEEITPSAFRKWLRVSLRQPSSASVSAALIIVRAVAPPDPAATPASDPLPPRVSALMADFPKVFEEAEGVEKDPPVRHPIRL